MKVEEIYELTRELVDTNSHNQISLDISRFVLFYNKAQIDYLRTLVDNLEPTDRIQYAQKFLVPSNPLKEVKSIIQNEQRFELPQDLIKREEILVTGSKGKCSGLMYVEEVRPSDISFLLTDEYNKPSYEFRESFYYIGGNSVVIYNDGTFKINDINIVYYRQPENIQLAGYEDEFGNLITKNVETEWGDDEIYDIVELLVSRYAVAKLPTRIEN